MTTTDPADLATETIARMTASLEGYGLTPKKDGYYVKFFIDLNEGSELLALNQAIQRIVVLTVTRPPRRLSALLRSVGQPSRHLPLAFLGSDD